MTLTRLFSKLLSVVIRRVYTYNQDMTYGSLDSRYDGVVRK